MKAEIDMHCHSYFSDGSFLPAEIVKRAKYLGLKAVVLTDHEIFAGQQEFHDEAQKKGLQTVSGIELPAKFMGKEVHVLAYGLDYTMNDFDEYLKICWQVRNERTQKQIDLVNKKFNHELLSLEDLHNKMKLTAKCVYFWPFHDYIIKKMDISSANVHDLVGYGAEFHVEYDVSQFLELSELVKTIYNLGGMSVLAHPGEFLDRQTDDVNEKEATLVDMINSLLPFGLKGVEVYSNKHTSEDILLYKKIVNQFGLIATAGSDWHGKYTPLFDLGIVGMSYQEFLQNFN